MILVNGEPIEDNQATSLFTRKDITDACSKFQSLSSDPERFAGRKFAFVLQAELAEVDIAHDPEIMLSSSQATTCVVGVAVCRESNTACICHMDGGSSSEAHLQRWLRGMTKPTVYLVGGYKENTGSGVAIIRRILNYLRRANNLEATLGLLCVGQMNTNQDGSPICCDVTVDVASGTPYPVSLEQWSPVLVERDGKAFVSSEILFAEVWNTTAGSMEIKGYDASLSNHLRQYIKHLLMLPDDELLLNSSTSPAHERPQYVADRRRVYNWLLGLDKDGALIPTKYFSWSNMHGWIPVSKIH